MLALTLCKYIVFANQISLDIVCTVVAVSKIVSYFRIFLSSNVLRVVKH